MIACPKCGAATHRCRTGDPGCRHCGTCAWSGVLAKAPAKVYVTCEHCESTFRLAPGAPMPAHRGIGDGPCNPANTVERRALIRAAVAARPPADRCHPECPGWIVSESSSRGARWHIERCDECATIESDDDAAMLPEAQAELRRYRHGRAGMRGVA